MKIANWPTDKPIPYERNARKISEAAVRKVAASIKEFGWRQPIVVDASGVVVAGHTRLLAAKQLGIETVPVHVATELTPEQVRTYRLMDNRSHEEAEWDYELLGGELLDLKALDVDLGMTGFDEDELSRLLVGERGLTDDDEIPEPPTAPLSVAGDLWRLGNHRLFCGDGTKPDTLQRLMLVGEQADMAFTDPPYNVDYEGYTEDRLTITGDKMTSEQFSEFLLDTFQAYKTGLKLSGSMYVCHPSLWQRLFQNALEVADFEVRCQIIWGKNTFAWGFGRYKFQHEPIFYCHRRGQKDPWYGDKSQSTLWMENKPAANRLHPTMKPVELVIRALLNSSKAGNVVLDLFGGSGSTLIACEKAARAARLVELDPAYCDVIVERWQKFTGRAATLESDGLPTFAEVQKERLARRPARAEEPESYAAV
jgi:DNA modification methylase